MDNQHKKALLADLDLHAKHNRLLFPLKKGLKTPLEVGWTDRKYPRKLITRYIRNGCNVAWKIGAGDVVIDIDPRQEESLGSLKRLKKDWPELEETPIVITGADQGLHYYLKLPRKVKIKTHLQKYPGVDFRHIGQYVVVANSLHPNGNYYQWDILSPYTEDPATIPDWLFEWLIWDNVDPTSKPQKVTAKTNISEPTPTRTNTPNPSPALSFDTITSEALEYYLNQLDVLAYQDYHQWLNIAMASHSATAGEGLDVFVDWCMGDSLYSDDERDIRRKWRSFKAADTGITLGTITKAVLEAGGELQKASAKQDFFDVPIIEPKPKTERLEDFLEHLETLPPPPKTDLEALIKSTSVYGTAAWETIRKVIKESFGITYKSIDRVYIDIQRKKRKRQKKTEKDESPDYGILVANRVLTGFFEDGEHLLHAKNQQFYHYRSTHWELLPQNLVDKFTFEAAEDLESEPNMIFKPSTILPAAERVLVAKCAHVDDVLRLSSAPPPVINTTSCEVWLDRDMGEPLVKEHDPKSYLLNCLDTVYDPSARCPLFDSTLLDIFSENKDPEEMVRHFLEFFGYVIQPFKNIPSWWLFHGRGSNGKTILMEVVQALLGDAVLPRPVADFADTGRNNHATANLVGKLLVLDDDADVNAFLPESALKKLAESKLLESNPKAKDAFTFRSTATPVVLINDWPRTKDLSHGMLRKSFIIPFKRSFDPLEQDLTRKDKIIDAELPGVLNRALQGYKRLRTRGGFLEPADCVSAKVDWLRLANPLMEFVASQTQKRGNGTYSKVGDLYEQYRVWCHNQGGVSRPLMQNRFEISMLQLGYRTDTTEDVKVFRGIEMKA